MSLHTNTNPFVGLRPFESDESLLFFGRQEQTVELLQRLHQHHFVAIIGNSGCGKSSIIRGGLIPRLKAGYLLDGQDHWMIAMMKPGQTPMHNLAEAILNQLNPESDSQAIIDLVNKINEEGVDALLDELRPLWEREGTNFFLLVDQFEELFRFSMNQKEVEKKDEAIDFVKIILGLSRQVDLPVYLVMTMRSDFIGDCAQFYGLPEAMNQSQYLVPRLNRGNLRNAIVGPVKLYGNTIDPVLTSRLLNEAVALKDELPLLQHTLMRIWDHEMNVDKNGRLDLGDYEKIGGIEKALSIHADEALEGMSEDELALTKEIFQSLTIIDENGRKIRRPVLMSELVALTGETREKLMSVISCFIEEKRSFLILSKVGHTNEEVIDISHESLIRQWSTLAAWSDEEASSAKIYLHLKESAELFKEKKKDLLEGSEFQVAMEWYKTFNPSLVWAQRYNDGFTESIEYLLESEKHQKFSEKKKKSGIRNRRILIFISVIFLLITVGFYIAQQRFKTIKEAFALNSVAQEEAIDDPTVALRIGEAAYKKYSAPSILAIAEKIYRDNAFYKTLIRDSFEMPVIAVSDTLILTGSNGGNAKLYNIQGKLIKELTGENDAVGAVAISPKEKKLVTGASSGIATLWNFEGKSLMEFKQHEGAIKAIAFSPNGDMILTGSADNTAILWGLNGKPIHTFKKHTKAIRSVAFAKDGLSIITGSEDKTAIVWRVADEKIIKVFSGHSETVGSVSFSLDGKTILTGSHDKRAVIWSLTGEMIQEFIGHGGPVLSARFSPGDESRVLTASYDGKVKLWSVHDGEEVKELRGHAGTFWAAEFLSDGNGIITSGSDPGNSIRSWSLGKNFSKDYALHTDSVLCVAFSPDGNKIATGSADGTARLLNLVDSSNKEIKGVNGRVNAIAFSPHGDRLVICSGNAAELKSLNSDSGFILTGHTGRINSVAFSPKDSRILTASSDGTIRLWFYSDGKSAGPQINGDNGPVLTAVFAPDDKTILIVFKNGTVASCNPDGSDLMTIIEGDLKSPLTSAVFSPNQSKVARGYKDGSVKISPIEGYEEVDDDFHEITIHAHEDEVFSIAFSPDGNKLLTGSADNIVKVWNMDGYCLSVLTGHDDCVLSVTFSPDGQKILSGAEDKSTKLWTDRPLAEFLKSDLLDQLTDDQRKKFGVKK